MTNSLSKDLASVLRRLRELAPNDQINAIVNNPEALALVRALPDEELFLTINEVGLSDSLELIELLSSEQVQTIFDLDVWQHDVIDNDSLTEWIGTLQSANPRTALKQMRDADIEL